MKRGYGRSIYILVLYKIVMGKGRKNFCFNNIDAGTDKIIRISTSIKESDRQFCRQHSLKISKLIREGIDRIRDYEEGEVDFKTANHMLQGKIEFLALKLNKVYEAVEDGKSKEEIQKI